jgi:tRNA 2-thiocytidine biosynthesis protein TtcA
MKKNENFNWFLIRIQRRTGKAVEKYDMLHEGDRLLCGLSGGKDSLVMLHSLYHISRSFPFRFEMEAVYVNVDNVGYQANIPFLTEFCASLGVPFHVANTHVNFDTDKRKQPCFLCSWNRRKTMFSLARELNCNKIAFGHHKDDIVETLLLNMTFQGSVSTMPPKLNIFKGEMQIIRPLSLVTEEESRRYAEICNFILEKEKCPYDNATKRKAMRELLNDLEKIYPKAKNNIFNSLSNIQEEYLPGN